MRRHISSLFAGPLILLFALAPLAGCGRSAEPTKGAVDGQGAAAEGFEIILTCAPPGAERMLRKVRQRLQARGAVLVVILPTNQGERFTCDVELVTSTVEWLGIGSGHGGLVGRRVSITSQGRRSPRSLHTEVWLPGPDGRVGSVA